MPRGRKQRARRRRCAPGADWFDDWYSVTKLDARTFAIAEPRYEQHNVNYLIVGDARAVLFDTGPGVRDIRPVVASLTDRPVVAAFSHLHFDHIGGQALFADIASLDHPSIRARTEPDGTFTPTIFQHGGPGRPSFRITTWWEPDATSSSAVARCSVLSVPGHTPESLALYDADAGQLFSGDYLYAGDLFAFAPGSDLVAYRDTARRLLEPRHRSRRRDLRRARAGRIGFAAPGRRRSRSARARGGRSSPIPRTRCPGSSRGSHGFRRVATRSTAVR